LPHHRRNLTGIRSRQLKDAVVGASTPIVTGTMLMVFGEPY
jgi:hypothetical protein